MKMKQTLLAVMAGVALSFGPAVSAADNYKLTLKLSHVFSPAEDLTKFMDEVSIKPRLVDPQSRVGQQAIAIEALDVIAFEGRTITPDVDTVLMHGPHQ